MAQEQEHNKPCNQISARRCRFVVSFGLFFCLESFMSRIPQEINKLQRELAEIDVDIRRADKRGNTLKKENLLWKKGQMLDILTELRYYC
jgi:hypothetical protein